MTTDLQQTYTRPTRLGMMQNENSPFAILRQLLLAIQRVSRWAGTSDLIRPLDVEFAPQRWRQARLVPNLMSARQLQDIGLHSGAQATSNTHFSVAEAQLGAVR